MQQQNVKISQCGFVLYLGFITETSNWANSNHQCGSNAVLFHSPLGTPNRELSWVCTSHNSDTFMLALLLVSGQEGSDKTKPTLTLHYSI